MPHPLTARRAGADVEVSNLHPSLPGWTVTVHGFGTGGGITITPARGARITEPAVRLIRIGAVLDAADALTAGDRLTATVDSLGPLPQSSRAPGPERDRQVVAAYRQALAEGVTPRVVIATWFGIPEQTAGRWIADLRALHVLGTIHEERARLAGRNA